MNMFRILWNKDTYAFERGVFWTPDVFQLLSETKWGEVLRVVKAQCLCLSLSLVDFGALSFFFWVRVSQS